MNKKIPFIFSVFVMVSIALIAILGNTQSAFAGSGCIIDPPMADLGPVSDGLTTPKTIECLFDDFFDVVIDTSDCDANQIVVFFDNISIDPNGVWTADEIVSHNIPNDSPKSGTEIHCNVQFSVIHEPGATSFLTQSIWLIAEKSQFVEPVGGKILSIDSTALVLAGLQTSVIWMPVLAGAVGVGFAAFKIRKRF